MTLKGCLPFLVASVLALATTVQGQRSSSWRVYKLGDGLPESPCLSVALAGQGKVLVKHLNLPSLSELDGYGIEVLPALEQASGRVYASPGGQLWTVVAEGLQEFREGSWLLHPVPEIAAEFRTGSPRLIDPIPLCPVKQGQVIFLLPDRLMKLNLEDPEHPHTDLLWAASQTQLQKFFALIVGRDGGLWVGGARGLAKAIGPARNIKADTGWTEFLPPESLGVFNFQELHEDEENSITAVATARNEQKAIVHFDGHRWRSLPAGAEKIRHGWRGLAKTLWATTIDSLLQERAGELVENEEISARQYFDVAVEPGGVFWLATSEGLFRYAPLIWRNPMSPTETINSVVQSLTADSQDRFWFVAGNTLHCIQETQRREFALPLGAARTAQGIRALFPLKDGSLLLESGDQDFRFDTGTATFAPVRNRFSDATFKPLGLLRDRRLGIQYFEDGVSGGPYKLGTFDGERFEPFPEPVPDTAMGATLSTLYAAQNGDLWLSGERGTACLHEKKWRSFISQDKSMPEAAISFAEMPDGKVWCATPDAVWEFDGKTWSALRRGLDRVTDMVRGRDGSVWVASNGGIHRFFQGAWAEKGVWVDNAVEEGLPSAGVRKLCEDHRGRIWAGTTRGLSLYHPEADAEPPRTVIQELTDREKSVAQGDTITVSFKAQDKWNYTPRERLVYSYRLDDRDWSPFQETNHISFIDLPAGKHYFQVRAMDRNCNLEPKPANVEFAVVLPWYKETRLLLISVSGLAGALFFAGLAFNRHRQLLKSYAAVEEKVAQRTRELELANRELLHSQKMNALGTLAAGIAHDFNNILSIIKGSAQIIEDNVDQPQKILTRADRIKTVVEQGAGIVKAMLGFSRDSEQQTGLCDINSVVEDTLRLLGDRFLREVEVRFEPAVGLPQVPCAKDFLQQILLNFIFNASEAMTATKQIIVATRQLTQLPGDLVLKPARADLYLSVSVQDFGCGIAPENRGRIFEPFFTTKALSARRGTGLGLSMVYQLATKMGAGLAVDSVLEQGSTFSVILPLRDATPEIATT
jgi:signal transduction histidine kinase/ligand-binding sensor domain-containing protein